MVFSELWVWQVPEYALWGSVIAVYLFLGGVGGGAYVAAAIAEIKGGKYEAIARTGSYISPIVLIVGSGLLLFDLANPLKGILIPVTFLNPKSWMAWGAWLLLILIILGVIYANAWRTGKSKGYRLGLAIIGLPIGIAVGAYTGFLLRVLQFVPLWHTTLLPLLFTISAMSTGIAATGFLTLVSQIAEKSKGKAEAIHKFSIADDILIILEIVVIAAFILTMKAGPEAARTSISLITSSRYALPFWGGVIIIGLILPLLLSSSLTMAKKYSEKVVYVEFGGVLIGGLILRLLIIAAAVKQPLGTVPPIF